MLPQSSPDAREASASEEAVRSRRSRRVIWLTGALFMVVLLFLALEVASGVSRVRRRDNENEAVGNARQIGLALSGFEAEYGKFPDASTIPAVEARTGTVISLGTGTSNDYFRQLIATGVVGRESIFYAGISGGKRPDNNIFARQALVKGEVGFAYLSGLSQTGNPLRALAMTPLIPGTDRFDPEPFGGRAIILRVDNTVAALKIGEDGHAIFKGMNLLDPKHPVWAGERWTLVWPE